MQPSDLAGQEIAARIDRLPGFISIGLIKDGIYTLTTKGFLDFRSFPSFLASCLAATFQCSLLFG